MKRKQKFFVFVGILFAISILLISAQFIIAQTWTAPTAPFPSGNTYPPIDTSENSQAKLGGLILGTGSGKYGALSFPENRIISSGNNTFTLNASGNVLLYSPKSFSINTQGLVLPKMDFI